MLITSRFTDEILRFAVSPSAVFTVSLSTASDVPVTAHFTTESVTAFAGSDYVETVGTLTIVPGQTTASVIVPTLDDSTPEPGETFTISLDDSVGATITDGVGIATIQDDDTKFYVVNDAALTRRVSTEAAVFRGKLTASTEQHGPRGAASTIAGDKVWVVDANKNVYVYNTSGGLLGSWSLGSLSWRPTSKASPPTARTCGSSMPMPTRSTSTPAPPAASRAARTPPPASS